MKITGYPYHGLRRKIGTYISLENFIWDTVATSFLLASNRNPFHPYQRPE